MDGMLVGINFAIGVAGTVICSLGLVLALITRLVQPKTRHYLVAVFATLVVYTASDLFGQVGDEFQGQAWVLADRIALFFESALPTFALLILTSLLLYTCGRDWRHNIAFDVVGALWLVYIVLLVQTQFTGNLYSVGDDNVYRRGAIGVNTKNVSCDYYDFLAGDPVAIAAWRGEYMSQYSWAETTKAALA